MEPLKSAREGGRHIIKGQLLVIEFDNLRFKTMLDRIEFARKFINGLIIIIEGSNLWGESNFYCGIKNDFGGAWAGARLQWYFRENTINSGAIASLLY